MDFERRIKRRIAHIKKKTNNGYLNFLNEFRVKPENADLPPTEVVRVGASIWRTFTSDEKLAYKCIGQTANAQQSEPHSDTTASVPAYRKQCHMWKSNNPYINFLSEYRQQPENYNLPCPEIVRMGAKLWSTLTEHQKEYYRCSPEKSEANATKRLKHVVRHKRPADPEHDWAYLHFVRYFSQRVCNLTPTQTVVKATRIWRSMTDKKKDAFCHKITEQIGKTAKRRI